jgi:AhpD family alkylhydroperoxidase
MTARMNPQAPRLPSPSTILPDVAKGIHQMIGAIYKSGAPRATLELVHLRVSQVNACGACIDSGWRGAKKAGESDERLHNVAAWRHTPYFSDAERAALALAESMTRLADEADAVPDAVWAEAARHHDEKSLAAIVAWIGLVNLFNRMNVATGVMAAGEQWS